MAKFLFTKIKLLITLSYIISVKICTIYYVLVQMDVYINFIDDFTQLQIFC